MTLAVFAFILALVFLFLELATLEKCFISSSSTPGFCFFKPPSSMLAVLATFPETHGQKTWQHLHEGGNHWAQPSCTANRGGNRGAVVERRQKDPPILKVLKALSRSEYFRVT